jgi:hypothetical protein
MEALLNPSSYGGRQDISCSLYYIISVKPFYDISIGAENPLTPSMPVLSQPPQSLEIGSTLELRCKGKKGIRNMGIFEVHREFRYKI